MMSFSFTGLYPMGGRLVKPSHIWALFDWYQGACFRCEAVAVPVAHVGDITVRDNALPLFACHHCIFRMQQSHWFRTGRRAWPLRKLQLPSGPRNPVHLGRNSDGGCGS
jgi:hypothetical protein